MKTTIAYDSWQRSGILCILCRYGVNYSEENYTPRISDAHPMYIMIIIIIIIIIIL